MKIPFRIFTDVVHLSISGPLSLTFLFSSSSFHHLSFNVMCLVFEVYSSLISTSSTASSVMGSHLLVLWEPCGTYKSSYKSSRKYCGTACCSFYSILILDSGLSMKFCKWFYSAKWREWKIIGNTPIRTGFHAECESRLLTFSRSSSTQPVNDSNVLYNCSKCWKGDLLLELSVWSCCWNFSWYSLTVMIPRQDYEI